MTVGEILDAGPVSDDAGTCPFCHRQHAGVVGVEHRQPGGTQRGDQVAFLAGDGFQRAERLQVRRLDGRHHRDVRRCDPGQAADLAEVIRCHLQHRDAMLGAQLAQRDGQPIEAVVVGPILEDSGIRGKRTEHRGDGLLGRRFSYAAGDADNLHLLFRER